ncbi:hypothetical protein IAT40_006217 [Kwoniella sp. CBS 6097]
MTEPKARGLSQEELKQLEEISTCEISDALVKLGYKTGGHISSMNLYSPSGSATENVRVVGPAFTVQLVRQEGPSEIVDEAKYPRSNEHFVDACPPGSVILISSPFVGRAACWGGLMSTAAKAKGIKGAIIQGGCRDLAEHRALGFPVFAQFHSTLGQRSFLRPSQYNISLSIPLSPPSSFASTKTSSPNINNEDYSLSETTTVNPGDIIVADLDGVVAIPRDTVSEVVMVAKDGKDVDENVRKDLELGKGVKETMAKWRGK